MEQDLEDFDIWDASELDHLASDIFAENLEFFSSDGDPGLSNLVDSHIPTASIPVAESANLNTESAVLLPSLNQFNDYNPFFGASELPVPTQTTSLMQVPQFADPSEDEPFSSVNIDAVASYTDHNPSEFLAPIATANSVPVAQSTDFAGNEMSSSNYMDLDAPYADMDFSQFLVPTTTTSLGQATQSVNLMEHGTSRIIELDPDPVMAPSGPAPTGSEQLPPPVSTDRVLPAEVAQSVNPQMVFNGSGPPNPSYLTPQPQPFAVASNEITTTMPTPGNQLRPKSGNSVPSGGYVPIQPKPAAISGTTELPSTSEPQDSSPSRFPSQGTLASGPASSVSKGKRKRQRSPQAQQLAYKDCLHQFPTAAKEKQHQQPATKRKRSARKCLRCDLYNKPCSGDFPCERCVKLFRNEVKNRQSRTLLWKHCFDSDILELNFFYANMKCLTFAQALPTVRSDSTDSFTNEMWICQRNTESILDRAVEAACELMQIVQSSVIEAGISCLFGFQLYRLKLAGTPDFPTVPPLFSMMDLVPEKPLRHHKGYSVYPGAKCSNTWLFAATILRPDFLAELAGFNTHEILFFSGWICDLLFRETARLLTKAKIGRMGGVKEDWATLSDHLETIYCLITYHNAENRLSSQFLMAVDRSITRKSRWLEEIRKGYRSDAGGDSAVVSEVNGGKWKKDLECLDESVEMQQLNFRDFFKTMGGDSWVHLQAFIRHWLVKLEGGLSRYSEVMMKNFCWKTICRINHEDEIEDEGIFPPYTYDYLDRNFLGPALAMCQSLHPQGHETCETFDSRTLAFLATYSMDRPRIHCNLQCGWWCLDWACDLLDYSEEKVKQVEAKKGSNVPKNYSVLLPDNMPKEPRMTEFQAIEFTHECTRVTLDLRELVVGVRDSIKELNG